MANSSVDFINLDFDAQKSSLITFLKAQELFKDYDFEGSNLNVLIDLLVYNTLKGAFYTNMALNEGFIDSAQLRNSVLSHAKHLNYLPRSTRSAKATIQVDFEASGLHGPYVIQKGQSFTAQVKNSSFIFTIPETLTCGSANSSFSFTTDIYEGPYVKESFVYDSATSLPKTFKLGNENIDTDSITVNVFEDGVVTGTIYKKAISLLDLDGASKVFFIQTSAVDGHYEVLFGDGILGYEPKNGSLIVVDYRVSDGVEANGAGRFTINFDPTSPFSELTGDMSVTTITAATGGDASETVETTRFYAPRWFQTQERAVVPSDYEVLMKLQFPEIDAINVYGGEELTPPQFGKAIVALQLANIQGLPISKQQQYQEFLQKRMTLTVVPVFALPVYTYILVNSIVRYNINITAETTSRIKTIVLEAISEFSDEFLDDFNVTFRLSKLAAAIDDSDPSIVSNLTEILVYKEVVPLTNASQTLNFNFDIALEDQLPSVGETYPIDADTVLTSSGFTFNGVPASLEDDGLGNVRVVQAENAINTVLATLGTIDYETGIISIADFTIDSFDGPSLCVYVRPRDNDVSCKLNTILKIKPGKIDINVEQLQI